jgi:hypothetical protein
MVKPGIVAGEKQTEKVYNNEKLSVEEKILELKEVMYKT